MDHYKKNYRLEIPAKAMLHEKAREVLSNVPSKEELSTSQDLLTDAIECIGMGRYQWRLFFFCGFGWAVDQMILQSSSVIQLQVQREFKITTEQSSYITSVMMFGMLVSAGFVGYLSDIFGRRTLFIVTIIIGGFFVGATAFSTSYTMLCIISGLMGVGIGGNLPEFTVKETFHLWHRLFLNLYQWSIKNYSRFFQRFAQ